jgi:hypothetical protein
MTPEQIHALAEEAMHLAFSHLANRLDPQAKHDLGGFFGYHAETLSDRVTADLRTAADLANEYLNG